ncbi:hypothetical protein [uncultured Jannaschia sp.]|uniref:hypothetical protein n=1 Tax=uncultured Jannaschia sp. TaxID=293347 RepID=UPI0026237FDB|nr:hypothetical protein [uncultured Jannaschia sp.]
MRPIPVLCLFLLCATAMPALAQRVVSADEFARMVTGKTLRFDRDGSAFGAEQYFEDKRVIWAFESGQCQRGIWFANRAGEICFVYDTSPEPQCWSFLEGTDGRFRARLADDPAASDLVTREIGSEPLDCPLPDLGV